MVLRMQVEIRDEDVEPLRTLAWKDHRSVREHAGFLLHLKIQELEQLGALLEPEPDQAIA